MNSYRKYFRKVVLFVLIALAINTLDSCSDYNKVLKGENYELKYERAYQYFKEKKYVQALSLFEQVLPKYKLTPKGEDIYYHYAYCHWHLKDYYLAGFYFKQFVRQYPNSKFAEECAFLNAMCAVKVSPESTLDQTDTYTALEELQIFIDEYPLSARIDTCNKIMDKLRSKLEIKQYNYAKLYYRMENYKASYTALHAALQQFPNTRFREEMLYMMLNSAHKLAENSVVRKKMERYEETIKVYHKFAARYPESKYRKNAEKIFEDTKFQISLLKVQEKIDRVQNQKDLSKKKEMYTKVKESVAKFNETHNKVKVKGSLSKTLDYIGKDIELAEKKKLKKKKETK